MKTFDSIQTAALRMAAIFLLALCMAACDRPHGTNSPETIPTANPSEAPMANPMVKVIAVSPVLPPEARSAAEEIIETERKRLLLFAPVGATVFVMDAEKCDRVATLVAVKGATRMRARALAPPMAKVRGFFHEPSPKREVNGRMRFIDLCQVLGQMKLPPGTPVVVLGNPLVLTEGNDACYSMGGGAVPSDGMMFLDRKFSLYSVLGRERALEGKFFYWGYPNDQVFVNHAARELATRFFSVYLKAQAATLVVFQPSCAEANAASQRGLREAMLTDDPDPKAEPAMILVSNGIREKREVPERRARGPLPEGARPVGAPVLFSSNSAKLTREGREAITSIVAEAKRLQAERLILIASADAAGSEEDNKNLAQRRGDTVKAALMPSGLAVELLPIGETLASDEEVRDARQQSRAVRAYVIDVVTSARL